MKKSTPTALHETNSTLHKTTPTATRQADHAHPLSINGGIKQFKRYKRFCTPGHKGFLMADDITEIDTQFPAHFIENAQNDVAKLYGLNSVRFLTNGSSIGIKSALMSCDGDILASENSHQSIFEASELSGKKLHLIENTQKNGLKLPPTAQQITQMLNKNPQIGVVVLAHPDYYGQDCIIESAQAVKNAGKILYVDGAHGAHYLSAPTHFCTQIFKLADAFNISAHKTLYSLTQTAILGINNPNLIAKIDHNLKLLGTTSPFYPFYDSIQRAVQYNQTHAHKYEKLYDCIHVLKSKIQCAKNDDFTRIVVDANHYNKSGEQLYFELKSKKIIAEKFDERYVVFIVTLADSPKKIKQLLATLEGLCPNKSKG